ncbi:hypothetical protein [Streptomyces noursei]|uniref:hypothetical protein n=1 Tax=Streptomyces noursei TaxID=1971 RepID=UPI0023B87A8C|nr:hypothetical protein [Streptomyces noursei]
MPQPTSDDEQLFRDVASLGATANAARDEGLPPAVREALNDIAAEQADDLSRNHGTGRGTA